MLKRLIATTAVAALALTACSGGTGAGTAGGSGGGGEPVKKIKLVAAEYSKDNTAAFWNKFAAAYKAKTGIDLDVQVVSWDDIDQQSSTMIQNNAAPDILNLNAYASYAKDSLLYSVRRGALRLGEERPAAELRPERHLPGQDVRDAGPLLGPRAVLQQGPVRQGGHRGAAEDLGRVRRGRQEDHRPRRRHGRLRDAAGPRGGAGGVLHLDVQQRRQLEDRRQVDDQLPAERGHPDVPQVPVGDRQGHAEQPRQDRPH